MGNFVHNIAKGRPNEWGQMAGANDAFIVYPVEASGVEADSVLIDYDTLSALLAAANNEQATMGRKTVTSSVTVTVDDTNDRQELDIPDQTWTAATGNPISDIGTAYDYDTTAGTDANIVPCTWHDASATPAGGDITAQIHANGIYRAA